MSLWDWAVAAYERPGVADACLDLQDAHGQNTCFLLWAVWSGAADAGLLERAAEAAQLWESEVLGPLRQVRRALKASTPPLAEAAREALREEVKAAELKVEQALLEALGRLVPARRSENPLQALQAAAKAWGEPPPDEALARLADALSVAQLYAPKPSAHHGASTPRNAAMLDDTADEPEPALRARLAALKQEHADLDTAVQAMAAVPLPDLLAIGRLKRKKLQLKDEIARIEDLLTPDIIA
ncbi:TIGR02444 family protein [Phenylobacterium terrae]|uniref:TIGR02444 family protein n=1 Tax=Phenylobacterium terrae TaxID=2665495 RepID=A0ABW4N0D4_9CAUL